MPRKVDEETRQRFIHWVATPRALRVPTMQNEFEKTFGVNQSTLWRWKQQPGFWEEVREVVLDAVRDQQGDLLKLCMEKALAGEEKYFEWAIKMSGLYHDMVETRTSKGEDFDPEKWKKIREKRLAQVAKMDGDDSFTLTPDLEEKLDRLERGEEGWDDDTEGTDGEE